MSEIHYLGNYSPSSSDVYFFDNNIWMLLLCPIADAKPKLQKEYSIFLSQITQRNCTIFVNSLILSEFANSFLRLEYNFWREKAGNAGKEYKRDFTKTTTFSDTVVHVKSAIEQILKICKRGSDDFHRLNLDKVSSDFGIIDYNDSYFLELCTMNKWKLVTQDKALIDLPCVKKATIVTFRP